MGIEQIQQYAAKAGIKEEELVKQYTEIVDAEKVKGKTPEAADHIAMLRIRAQVRSELKDNSEFFEGVILSPGNKNRYMQGMYKNALRVYNNDPEQAKQEGLVNDDGEPIDRREVFNSGKANPDFGKVITEIDYGKWNNQQLTYEDKGGQDVIGLCKRKNEDEVKKFKMTLFDGNGRLPIEVGKFIKFKATVRNETNEEFTLNVSSRTQLNETIDETPFNVTTFIEEGFMGELIPLQDMEQWFIENKNNYNAFFVTQGVVERLSLNGSQQNTVTLADMELNMDDDLDNEREYRVWLPKSSRIDFAEGSIVYALGGRRAWITDDGVINMQEAGIYAPEEYRVDLNEIDELNDLVDEEIDFDDEMI